MNSPDTENNDNDTLVNDTLVLKENINEYLNINDEISKLRKRIKDLTINKKQYEGNIISFMKNQNISDINSQNSKIKFNSSFRKESINKKVVQSQISKYFHTDSRFKNSDIDKEVNNLVSFIYKNREKTQLSENLSIKNIS